MNNLLKDQSIMPLVIILRRNLYWMDSQETFADVCLLEVST